MEALLLAAPGLPLRRAVRELECACGTAILDEIAQNPFAQGWNIDVARDWLRSDDDRICEQKFANALLAAVDDPVRLHRDSCAFIMEDVRAALAGSVRRWLTGAPWDVAIPLVGLQWDADRAGQPGAVVTPETLKQSWGEACRRNMPATRWLLGVAENVEARDGFHAFRKGKQRIMETTAGLVLPGLSPANCAVSPGDIGILRRRDTGEIRGQALRDGLRPSLIMEQDQMELLSNLAAQLAERWSGRYQREFWPPIKQALRLLQRAREAGLPADRYLFLWIALETALSNLSCDSEQFERVVPIGLRVAYRAPLVLVPPESMRGITYREARWLRASELSELYRIRNAVAHEGQQAPAVDEVLMDRFEAIVVGVLLSLVVNGMRYRIQSVQEFLAWCEHIHPAADRIA